MTRRTSVRIDMTPMVDVAFLLLIFFMSTTQFRPPEAAAVRLPGSSSAVRIPETAAIILTLDREGRLTISNERGTDARALSAQDIPRALVEWRRRNPEAVIVLKGDKDAPFGAVADLMDALAAADALRFNLMTEPERAAPAAPVS